MGTFLASGIATKIYITKKKDYWSSNYDIYKEKDKIFNILNQMIDVSYYEITEYEDGFKLEIKKEIVEQNIHELIKEVSLNMDCKHFFFFNLCKYGAEYKNINLNNFNINNYPITMEKVPESNQYRLNDTNIIEYLPYDNFRYSLLGNYESYAKLDVEMYFIPIWMDYDKTICEDSSRLLYLLNTFSRQHFKSKLSKSLLFYIMG